MNPVIIIPSYWTKTLQPTPIGEMGIYDDATPIDRPLPELETCLASLEQVRGVLRVVILLVAPHGQEESARARVDSICRAHPDLNPMVIGSAEAYLVRRTVRKIASRMDAEVIGLRGYGAIRNLGLAVAAVFGHDVAVFLDDDNIVLDENFLIDATYGLGMQNRQSRYVLAKTGRFIDANDSPYADEKNLRWSDRWWPKEREFNALMRKMLEGKGRLARANDIYHGCFALHVRAFSRVPFDSWITRGEALDYLINLRMAEIDVWFDRDWLVRRIPPEHASEASKYLQDVYRWCYERRKIEYENRRIASGRITLKALAPYPSEFVSDKLEERVARTSFARAVSGPERNEYRYIWRQGRHEADEWAKSVMGNYAKFLTFWPRIVATLWNDPGLARRLTERGCPKPLEGDEQ